MKEGSALSNFEILILYKEMAIIMPNSTINISLRSYVTFFKFASSKAKTKV